MQRGSYYYIVIFFVVFCVAIDGETTRIKGSRYVFSSLILKFCKSEEKTEKLF